MTTAVLAARIALCSRKLLCLWRTSLEALGAQIPGLHDITYDLADMAGRFPLVTIFAEHTAWCCVTILSVEGNSKRGQTVEKARRNLKASQVRTGVVFQPGYGLPVYRNDMPSRYLPFVFQRRAIERW
jgi:hypothetical protein